MKQELLNFYLQTSIYTNYLPYEEYYKSLPDDMEELGKLLCHQVIHRTELIRSFNNTPRNYENKYELKRLKDEYPWYRNRCDDDILLTAPAITAELFRQDNRGFIMGRDIANRVVITCRYVAVLLASILKAKGIPARCRSGYANYFLSKRGNTYYDHWIVQYFDYKSNKWINIDCDGIYDVNFDQYNMPDNEFKWAAQIWLDVRNGKDSEKNYIHGSRLNTLNYLAYALFFDFHSVMNDEISYLFLPTFFDTDQEFDRLSEKDFEKIDELATLMLDVDKNFDEIKYLFRNDKWLRIINTPLLSDFDHLELKN